MTFSRLLLSAALVGVGVPSAAMAQSTAITPDAMRGVFAEVAATVVKAAESVPADKYGFRPTSGVRSFGELVGHIADGNNYYCQRAVGKDPEWKEIIAVSGAAKDDLIARLKESIAACTAAHTAANAGRGGELLSNYGHVNHHYGNMVTYMRLLGVTPPAT